MKSIGWWKRTLMAAGVIVAVAAILVARPGQGRSAEAPAAAEDEKNFRYAGSKICSGCHAITKDGAKTPFDYSVDFIKLDESVTWDKEDKHSVAYKRLSSDRGKRIADLLKIDVNQREAGCLGCHSASIAEVTNRRDQGVQFNPSEGVSCENCHGPYSGWAGEHSDSSFRYKTSEEWAKVGFVDLRSPDRQAEKCLSCHVGNRAEGKLVTHEMYAAGHPPLPSIEVATFTNFIPRHWWLLSERKDPKLREKLGYKEGQLEQSKLALVGAAVALKTSMKLIADEAKVEGKTDVPGEGWPDYARFDCWSCHHDLKRESWRQARGYSGPPGRVPVGEWPLTLVELGIEHLNEPALAADLLKIRKELQVAANARPFGRRAEMARAAEGFAGLSEVLIKKLTASSLDKSAALKILRKLVERAERSTPDYDGARHVAWTIKLLVEELGDALPGRAAIVEVIRKFDEGLKLNLPAGRGFEIEDQLAGSLQTIGDYEPSTFRDHLKQLLGLLPPG